MLDFFNMIGSYIETFFSFFSNWLESILTFLGVVFSAQFLPATLASATPGIIGSCVFGVSAVAIIKLIVGR